SRHGDRVGDASRPDLRGDLRVRAIPILPGSPITAGQRPASHATVWIDHRRLTPRGGIPLPAHLHVPYQRKGEHALVIVTRRNHRDVGYRFIAIDVR
ncbi:MAG: hypothetical protein KAI47_21085, partial [Deltaproteobacteria bacterium]|nr:hypothetical protein [Deltaproteobacteria bacterium]